MSANTAQLHAPPGGAADLTLDVVNTDSVIDGITARVVGLPVRHAISRPEVLPLFPDAAGQLTITIQLPASFPAGRHAMTVEVVSRQKHVDPEYVNVDLIVPHAPAVGLTSRPELVRARRTGRYIATVTNRGNVLLDTTLTADDPQKECATTVEPALMSLRPGASTDAVVVVRARRKMAGSEVDHGLMLTAEARAVAPAAGPELNPPAPDEDPDGSDDDGGAAGGGLIRQQRPITFRQRPIFTRGVITALILLAIIALWAAAFLFGLSKVFAGDPLTKTAPASFFAATPAHSGAATAGNGQSGSGQSGNGQSGSGQTGSGQQGADRSPGGAAGGGANGAGESSGDGGPGDGGGPGSPRNAAPAGALPKTGALPPGVGGSISGTVTAKSSGEPVPRIQVEALRVKSDGSTVPAGSAATQSDGSYQVAGLFPGPYLLKFTAPGFRPSYYPAATSLAAAKPITARAGKASPGGDAVVTGLPATISGKVDPGDVTKPVKITVSAQLVDQGPGQDITIPDVQVTSKGSAVKYVIPDVPAPGKYQLTFTTQHYDTASAEATVTGGAHRFQSTVVLAAGNVSLAGSVTDGTEPLGGATVSTTVNGKEVSTKTATSGQVGHFSLGSVPSPGTYVMTVSKDGYGTVSQVLDVAAGQEKNDLTFTLDEGTGVVQGRLVDSAGDGLGGATVTVGGIPGAPTTTTLTDGNKGAFRFSELPTPGSYTLTFQLDGYIDQTVPVILQADEPLAPITVTMSASVGSVTGKVTASDGKGVPGASVTATDGERSWPVKTTSTTAAGQVGAYTIADLPAGLYTVTASDSNGHRQTALATVTPDKPAKVNFQLDTDS